MKILEKIIIRNKRGGKRGDDGPASWNPEGRWQCSSSPVGKVDFRGPWQLQDRLQGGYHMPVGRTSTGRGKKRGKVH